MEEIEAKLLQHQHHYKSLKSQCDKLFKSLTDTIEWLQEMNSSRKINIENVKRIKNEIQFIFVGIKIYIQAKYSSTKGIIEWGTLIKNGEVESRISLYREEFDKHGNIHNLEKDFSDASTNNYRYSFFQNLITVVERYFEHEKEADFNYEK